MDHPKSAARAPFDLPPGEENNFTRLSFPFVPPLLRLATSSFHERADKRTYLRFPFKSLLFIYLRKSKQTSFQNCEIIINKLNERPASHARMHAIISKLFTFFLSRRNNYIYIYTLLPRCFDAAEFCLSFSLSASIIIRRINIVS